MVAVENICPCTESQINTACIWPTNLILSCNAVMIQVKYGGSIMQEDNK